MLYTLYVIGRIPKLLPKVADAAMTSESPEDVCPLRWNTQLWAWGARLECHCGPRDVARKGDDDDGNSGDPEVDSTPDLKRN